MNINIEGLDKAQVLQALFNSSKQQGLGLLNPNGKAQMTLERAQGVVETYAAEGIELHFDYLMGRVMKVSLNSDEFSPRLYDRDNGEGSAAAAIAGIKAS
jgi:hypothetical protein